MKNGETYRGMLLGAEETMNLTLNDVVRTARNGQISKLPSVYLRGNGVRFIALPELLKNSPTFKKVAVMKKKMEQNTGKNFYSTSTVDIRIPQFILNHFLCRRSR